MESKQVKQVSQAGGKSEQGSQGGDQKARSCLEYVEQSEIFEELGGKEVSTRSEIAVGKMRERRSWVINA